MQPPVRSTQQTVVVQRQTSAGARFAGILVFLTVVFIIFGFLFASDATREWVEAVWVVALTAIAGISTITAFVYAGIAVYEKWMTTRAFYPDANGNLPVLLGWGGKRENLNLAGLSVPRHDNGWLTWQIAKNPHTGSMPAVAAKNFLGNAQPPLRLIEGPGASIVVDAVAEEMK